MESQSKIRRGFKSFRYKAHENQDPKAASQPNQEHWSPDCVETAAGSRFEATAVQAHATSYAESPTARSISESSAGMLEKMNENAVKGSEAPSRPASEKPNYLFVAARLTSKLLPSLSIAGQNPPDSQAPRASPLRKGEIKDSITKAQDFDFDEDDLTDEEDDSAKKVEFHLSEIDRCIQKGRFDDTLFAHTKAVVENYGVFTEMRLVICLAVMYLSKGEWAAGQKLLAFFKFDLGLGPEFNLAAYLLRAQVYLKEGDKPYALRDCRRAIKLLEKYNAQKTGGKGENGVDLGLNKFENAAFKILLECVGDINNEADRLYYDSKYQAKIPDPFLPVGPKLKLRILFIGTDYTANSVQYNPEELELLDDLSTQLQQERPKDQFRTAIVMKLPQNTIQTSELSRLAKDFGISSSASEANQYNRWVGSQTITFPQKEDVMRVLEYFLKSKMITPAKAICQCKSYL
ncbi:hypothetical protein ABW20_dc0104454 [Dactylellina cionopaga]|nr:hypothetical protein ABW20_dc0104454 [Dactylellina cionopaga]